MADARRRDAWDRAAALIAKVHNVHVTEEADLITPADIHPYLSAAESKKPDPVIRLPKKVQFSILKRLFIGK